MTNSRRTTSPLLGLVSVLLLIVGNELTKVGGGSPPLHGSTAEYAGAVGTSPIVIVGVYVVVAAWLTMAGFFLAVGQRLREHDDGGRAARAIAAGGVLAAAVGISGAPPMLAATVLAADGDLTPELAKALVLLNAVVFVLGWLLVAIPMGTAAVQLRRLRALPSWLCVAGIVLAALLAVGSVTVWWFEGAFLIWMLTMVWIATTSVLLTRRPVQTAGDVESADTSHATASTSAA